MGGGGNDTDTVDEEYNAGLLELAQESQGWAGESWNMFKYGVTYDPTETVTGHYDESGNFIEGEAVRENPDYDPNSWYWNYNNGQGRDSQREWVSTSGDQYIGDPQNTVSQTRGDIMGYNADDVTSEMEYLQNVVGSNQDILGLQTDVSRAELQSSLNTNPYREAADISGLSLTAAQNESALNLVGDTEAAARSGLNLTTQRNESESRILPYNETATISGLKLTDTSNKYKTGFLGDLKSGVYDVDPNKAQNEAQAGVQQGFNLARKSSAIDTASYGLDPSSGRYASTNRDLALSEASGIAGARSSAKSKAEDTNYSRRTQGLTI
jgi:hypothetical protein